jgi:GT2 family glycosyltransferase
MAMPRHLFARIGGFSTAFPLSAGEDRDFCDHWLHERLHMSYVPAAAVYHAHSLTLQKYFKQHFNYGRGAATYHQMRTKRGSGRFAIDSKFHLNARYWLIDPVLETRAWYRWLMPPLLVLSQVANLAGFFYERRRTNAAS